MHRQQALQDTMPKRRAQRRASPVWVWPIVAGAVALLAGALLVRVPDPPVPWLADLVWPGDTDAASTTAQVVAASVITVTALTFSTTVVALQLASQQFSPRLLREFTRDPVTRAVLSVLAATFVLALTVLRHLRTDGQPPRLAALAVFLMGLATLAAVLGFITHVVRILRVDSMMLAVHDETSSVITTFYPEHGDQARRPQDLDLAEPGTLVLSTRSGFVRLIDVQPLVETARDAGVLVRIDVRSGDHVVKGAPIATVWDESGAPTHVSGSLADKLRDHVSLGFERTLEQDAAFGFRQLEDIAVKALSPGINDPVTAAHAVGHLSDLTVALVGRRLGGTVHDDGDGDPRAIVLDRDLRYYLDLACGQVRRYGAQEPTALVALHRLLRDVASAAQDDEQRAEIARQARLVTASAGADLLAEDRAEVEAMEQRVHQALAGDLAGAYGDRAGETRSI